MQHVALLFFPTEKSPHHHHLTFDWLLYAFAHFSLAVNIPDRLCCSSFIDSTFILSSVSPLYGRTVLASCAGIIGVHQRE